MAIKFQFNKTSLNEINKQLKIRTRALPTLKNKESALLGHRSFQESNTGSIYMLSAEKAALILKIAGSCRDLEPAGC